MSRKKEKVAIQPYEYMSKYCKVENGVIVGLDMEKINARQEEIDELVKKEQENYEKETKD
jgi:hypothetical protein